MATNFPTSLDNLTNPTSSDALNNPSHAGQHANANDAIEALEAKVGVNSSAVTSSLDYRVTQTEAFNSFGFASGTYYGFNGGQQGSVNTTSYTTANRGYYVPFFLSTSVTFDRIAIRTGTTFSGSGVIRLGVYNNSNGKPSSLVFDAGTVSPTANSTIYAITINQTLNAGWYWSLMVPQTVATTNAIVSQTTLPFLPMMRFYSTSVAILWIQSISGSLPSTATPAELGVGSNFPQVFFRVA